MQGAECAYIIILGLIQCSNQATFNGFENFETCLLIENKPSQDTEIMNVKKDGITAIIFWALEKGTWQAKLPKNYKNKITGSNGTVETFTFCFKNTSVHDSGTYIWSDNQDNNDSLTLDVWYGPKINMTMHGNSGVVEYSDVNVTCSVDSYPVSNISWFRKNERLYTPFDGHHKRVLNLCNTTCDDSGIYTCSAYNGIGAESTKDIFIDVLCSPRFIGSYSGYNIKKMISASMWDKIQINVTIKANPSPEVISNTFYTVLTNVSDNLYDVFMRKKISSELDFNVHFINIGNSQGNVTIIIEVAEIKTIGYGFIIGLPLSLVVLLSITILVIVLVKRVKHQKDKQTENVNPTSNIYSGEYRINELYQSIAYICRDQSFNLDVQNEDNTVKEVSQCIDECPVEDGKPLHNKVTNSLDRKPEGVNVTPQSTGDKIKGRKPMPRPKNLKRSPTVKKW